MSTTTLYRTILSITTLSIKDLYVTLSINKTQHKTTACFIYCYAECHYADCHYAECRHTECRGAEKLTRKEREKMEKKK